MGEKLAPVPSDGKTHRSGDILQFYAFEEGITADAQIFSSAKTGLKLTEGYIISRDCNDNSALPYEISNVGLFFERLDNSFEWDSIDFLLYFYDGSGVIINKEAIFYRLTPVDIYNNNEINLNLGEITYLFDRLPEDIKVDISVTRLKGTKSFVDEKSHAHDAVRPDNLLVLDSLVLKKEDAPYWQKFNSEKTNLRLAGARVKKSHDNSESSLFSVDYGKSSYYIELDIERLNSTLELKSIEYLVTLFDKNDNALYQGIIKDSHPRFNVENISSPSSSGRTPKILPPQNLTVQIIKYTTADGKEVVF